MTKLDDFLNKQGKGNKYEEVGINATCSRCFESVWEGHYYSVPKILAWTCSHGHVSTAEDIDI